SLSRVCDAGRMLRLSMRLSLIRVWWRLDSPLITLSKSYTTRRSQPMIRSRLRRPTSKSMITVLWPCMARPVPIAALVVVLPTPPLPEVTTIISANVVSSFDVHSCSQWANDELIAFQTGLDAFFPVLFLQVFVHFVIARDGNQLRLQALTENAGIGVTLHAGQGAAPQRAIHMDVAIAENFGAGAYRRDDHPVAAGRIHLLAGTDGGG